MTDKETKSTMREFATNDQANYYSGITSITVNGKNAYELKGKFLDDLHKNAFCGTNGEDAVEHIEYFLRIVDPIDLPNVNQDKLRVVVFPILLVGDAWKCDEIEPTDEDFLNLEKEYWVRGDDEVELTDKESFDSDDADEVAKIFRIETNVFDFETPLCKAFKEFNNLLQIDPDVLTKDIDGFKTYNEYKDDWIYEWNKDIPWVYEKPWTENEVWKEPTLVKHHESENEIEHEDKERYEMFNDHERTVCYIRRFEMIKYSFKDDEEYVAIKENKYDDLMNTSKEAIHAYQEIFRIMDEGWMVTHTE
ncbi:hypothetical protein Tco_0185453 [Tanacetum coccineum]